MPLDYLYHRNITAPCAFKDQENYLPSPCPGDLLFVPLPCQTLCSRISLYDKLAVHRIVECKRIFFKVLSPALSLSRAIRAAVLRPDPPAPKMSSTRVHQKPAQQSMFPCDNTRTVKAPPLSSSTGMKYRNHLTDVFPARDLDLR